MEAKECRRCRQVKALEAFSAKSSARDQQQSYCKQCSHDHYLGYYDERKAVIVQRHYARTKSVRQELRKFVRDYLQIHCCVDCGEADPVVLEFDHVREQKITAIADMVNRCVPLAVLLQEIAKCEVRCANCHRRKTAVRQGWHLTI